MKVKLITLFCLSLLVFSCSKKDDPIVVPDPVQQDPSDVVTLKGKFIDAAVQGLSYSTTTQSGVTNANGEFSYVEGEEITFKVGNVVLGKALGQAEITPITIAQKTDANATIESKLAQNIAAFLQTLDADGDESNGISISQEVASNLGVSGVDFSNPVEAVLADIVLSVVQNAGVELDLVYPSDAANNMANSLGITYVAPRNMSLTHLIPTLKTYFQTSDRGHTPSSALYKNTFDNEGNLTSIDILSRYSGKTFFGLTFNSYNINGLPQNGALTIYSANSLSGAYPRFSETTYEIALTYNQDDQPSSLALINSNGINIQTEQFTEFDDENRPLSFFRDLAADKPNEDFTISWSFTYQNGLIATADRVYDQLQNIDANNSYGTVTTRDLKYGYNNFGNLATLNYTRIFISDNTIDGEDSSSITEAIVTETFNYDGNQKLTSQVLNEEVTLSMGDSYSSIRTRNYDANEIIVSVNYSSSRGNETNTNYEQGISTGSVTYTNGLLTAEQEYKADGVSTTTYIYYDGNGTISQKDIYEYGTDGLIKRTQEYYDNGNVYYTAVEEYTGNILTKTTSYNSDGVITYVSYHSETGLITRADIYFEGALNYYDEYEYNANGFQIRATSVWPDGEVYGIREFTYDQLGYTDTITYSTPDGNIYLTDVYEYDANNYLSKRSGYGANGNISYILVYEEGALVREELYDENGELVEVIDHSGTSGKRMVNKKKSKEVRFDNQNSIHQQLFSSDVDRIKYVPKVEFINTNLNNKNANSNMQDQRVSNTIRKIRMGQRN